MKKDFNTAIGYAVKCQFLIGTVLTFAILAILYITAAVSIPYRYGSYQKLTMTSAIEYLCQFLIGTVLTRHGKNIIVKRALTDTEVSIPYRYGSYYRVCCCCSQNSKTVSIPYRYGSYNSIINGCSDY